MAQGGACGSGFKVHDFRVLQIGNELGAIVDRGILFGSSSVGELCIASELMKSASEVALMKSMGIRSSL